MRVLRVLLLCVAMAATGAAGPVDFGRQELEKALAERKIPAGKLPVRIEVSTDPPETFRILPGRIAGGDLRGLMYGLLEAAEQVRNRGRLAAAKGAPAVGIRGVALVFRPEGTGGTWFGEEESWRDIFASLARSRWNRVTLLFQGQAGAARRAENLAMISRLAAEYAMDLGLGFRLEDLAASEGVNPKHAGPTTLLGLKELLMKCPAARSLQVSVSDEDEGSWQADFCRQWVFRAAQEAGRRVVLELRGERIAGELADSARESGIPARVVKTYRAAGMKSAGTNAEVVWRAEAVSEAGKSPAGIRRVVQECVKAGCAGLEIEAPPGLKGDWLEQWGRLSYDPAGPSGGLREGGKR